MKGGTVRIAKGKISKDPQQSRSFSNQSASFSQGFAKKSLMSQLKQLEETEENKEEK